MSADTKALIRERMDGWKELSRKHIPRDGDLTMVVLKAHLVIEGMLTSIICEHCAIPEVVPDVRLAFSQKLKLAQAVCGFPFSSPELIDAVSIINTIRNDLAHKLESKRLPGHFARAREIAMSIEEDAKPGEPKAELRDDAGTIHYLAGFCCAYLSAIDMMVHLKNQEASCRQSQTPTAVTPRAK